MCLRDAWAVNSFVSIQTFGLIQWEAWEALCQLTMMPHEETELAQMLAKGVESDVFLAQVAAQVQASEMGRWRGFYRAAKGTICRLMEGASRPRVCVPAGCQGDVLREAPGGGVLVGLPGIARTLASVSASYY